MHGQRFGRWLALAFMGALAACTSQGDGEGPAGNTNIQLIIDDGREFFTARYEMSCDGAGEQPTVDNTDIDTSREYGGDFEISGDSAADARILEIQTQLPVGECKLGIFVEDEDEVVCTDVVMIPIVPGNGNVFKFNVICAISQELLTGDALVVAGFTERTANTCPTVNSVNTLKRILGPGEFRTQVQARAWDFQNTCNLTKLEPDVPNPCDCSSVPDAIDPDACANGTVVDLGLAATACAVPADALTGGPGDALTIIAACTEGIGAVGTFIPDGFYFATPDADGNGILAEDVTYVCDPAEPGATVICWLFTDFDTECAQIRCDVRSATDPALAFSVLCPGDNECNGTKACDVNEDCLGQGSTCEGGTCTAVDCQAGLNECQDGGSCVATTGQCELTGGGTPPDNVDDGTLCESDTGQCISGGCQTINFCNGTRICDDNGDCGAATCNTATNLCNVVSCQDNNYCTTVPTCVTTTGACPANQPTNGGQACTPGSPDAGGDGVCTSGICAVTDPPAITQNCFDENMEPVSNCELGCEAAAQEFGLPVARVVNVGDLASSPVSVCFETQIPISALFIELAGATLQVDFVSGEASTGIIKPPAGAPLQPGTATWTNTVPGDAGEDTVLPGPPLDTTCSTVSSNCQCLPDGVGFCLDLLNVPAGGFWLVPFPEVCGDYTVPASGEQLCFNLKGTPGSPASETKVGIFARDAFGTSLPANFLCGPVLQAGLDESDVVCPVPGNNSALCIDSAVCEAHDCVENADCELLVEEGSICVDGECDKGTCPVQFFPDPNEHETCVTVP